MTDEKIYTEGDEPGFQNVFSEPVSEVDLFYWNNQNFIRQTSLSNFHLSSVEKIYLNVTLKICMFSSLLTLLVKIGFKTLSFLVLSTLCSGSNVITQNVILKTIE